MTAPAVLKWRVRIDDLGASRHLAFAAPPQSLEPLAKALNVLRVARADASLTVSSEGAGVRVRGEARATVTQACIVSLDPFEAEITELVDVRFAPDRVPTGAPPLDPSEEGSPGMVDIPEPIVDGAIDLGSLVQEFLALGVDPYPRKPGAQFEAPTTDAAVSPFAALAKLRREDGRG